MRKESRSEKDSGSLSEGCLVTLILREDIRRNGLGMGFNGSLRPTGGMVKGV